MQPDIGKVIDKAMAAIERQNPKQLRGVLPRICASAGVPAQALGELINLFSSIGLVTTMKAAHREVCLLAETQLV